MARIEIDHCTIFSVPLLKHYGIGYAQLIQFQTVFDDQTVTDNLLYPLHLHSNGPLNRELTIADIKYTFTPSLLMGQPKLRGADAWKIAGHVAVPVPDKKPEFKLTYQLDQIKPDTDLSKLTWYHVKNLDPMHAQQSAFHKIRKLGFFAEMNYLLLTAKLTMEWMIFNKDSIEDYFTKDDFENILGLKMIYAHVLSCQDR